MAPLDAESVVDFCDGTGSWVGNIAELVAAAQHNGTIFCLRTLAMDVDARGSGTWKVLDGGLRRAIAPSRGMDSCECAVDFSDMSSK
jgi:hypothetical protein